MKKTGIVLLVLLGMLFASCSEADRVKWSKNTEAANSGLTRHFTVYSSYTGQKVFDKTINNSYFSSSSDRSVTNGIDVEVLDLKTKLKTTFLGQNAILTIEEIQE